jgi:hypothetical protein
MYEIPLNYHSVVKPSMELQHPHTGIGRDCYTPLEWGLDRAIHDIDEYIEDYFQPKSRRQIGRPFLRHI